jgi:hypothetical protein
VATNLHSAAIRDAVSRIYLEVFPGSGIAEKLLTLPDRAYVGVTCSPSKGISRVSSCKPGCGYRAL